MVRKTPLKKIIRRKLIFRLGLTVLGVALFFAGLSYYHSKDMITRAVIQASTARIDVIRGRFKELMSRPGADTMSVLQDAVNYPPDTNIHINEGEFVYAVLHSEDRHRIGIYEHTRYPALAGIRQYVSQNPETYPQYSRPHYKSIVLDSRQYIDIHSKLFTGNDGSGIFLRAIFALSEQTTHSAHKLVIQIVLSVIGIVLVTVLLIYPVITNLINKLADFSTNLLTAHLETVEALGAAIAKRDSDTDSHNYRVTIYAVSLAEQLGIDGSSMQHLVKGAFLHDVGKIGIRDNILLNKAKLDENEFAIMQKHVIYGLDIIRQSSWLRDAEDVVGSHHEKYDGSGYPAGLKSDEIPLAARIFAIVDVFDALTSKRPYKKPFTYEQTMAIMEKESSTHFDPSLLDKFKCISKELYDEYGDCEDSRLKKKLLEITDRYFHSGIDTLLY